MAIAGRILVALGTGLLLLALFFFLSSAIGPREGWGPGGARFGLIVAAFPGLPGISALLFGIYLVRRSSHA
jgi:hypothetical protein